MKLVLYVAQMHFQDSLQKQKRNIGMEDHQVCTGWEVLSRIWMDHRNLVIHLSQQKKLTQGEEPNAK